MVLKLIDFGLAKKFTGFHPTTNTTHTTAFYEPPEISPESPNWDFKSDIFSYGMLLYEIAEHKYPFEDEMSDEQARKALKNGQRPKVSADVDPKFQELILWCWKQKQEERPTIAQVLGYVATKGQGIESQHGQYLKLAVVLLVFSIICLYYYNVHYYPAPQQTVLIPPVHKMSSLSSSSMLLLESAMMNAGFNALDLRRCNFSVYWFERSVQVYNNSNAMLKLGCIYKEDCLDENVKQNDTRAYEYFVLAAKSNNSQAYFMVGNSYFNGDGCQKNLTEATYWFTRSANAGDAHGQYNLAYMYYNGLYSIRNNEIETNLQAAFYWYNQSAHQNYSNALQELALCYLHGKGTKENPSIAVHWLQLAIEHGSITALSWLGFCYQHGKGVPVDKAKAFQLYMQGADKGEPGGMHNVAHCYEHGVGVGKNETLSKNWFAMAASKGDEDSKKRLK